MGKLKIAVIADRGQVHQFALNAIDRVNRCDEISLFSCTNTRVRRRPVRHGAYYAINLISVRNRLSRLHPLDQSTKRIAETVEFESLYDGAWQMLPDEIIRKLAGFDLVLKFGMSLMRVPPCDLLPVPILSYHHGDPDHYRGRPAGFYEMLHGAPVMGQIVQRISNKLDAGAVVAFAETKVYAHSYRSTLIEAYANSPLLINEAIANALNGKALAKPSSGKNYRLPSNGLVFVFLMKMLRSMLVRLAYGAFVEKKWQVTLARVRPEQLASGAEALPEPAHGTSVPCPPGYGFIADPFFNPAGRGVLVEGLNRRTGVGEILLVDGHSWRDLTRSGRHHSFPAIIEHEGEPLIVPEIASWSTPRAFRVARETLEEVGMLKLAGGGRIIDPVLFRLEGTLYLLGNLKEAGSGVLSLWKASSLFDEFRPHPSSPVRISPRGSRMAGAILATGDSFYRLGQDFGGAYGDGIFVFRIDDIAPDRYSERLVGEIRLSDAKGPHTLNISGDQVVYDWYRDQAAPLAWLRRLRARSRESHFGLRRADNVATTRDSL